jgi:hypothetical protein
MLVETLLHAPPVAAVRAEIGGGLCAEIPIRNLSGE